MAASCAARKRGTEWSARKFDKVSEVRGYERLQLKYEDLRLHAFEAEEFCKARAARKVKRNDVSEFHDLRGARAGAVAIAEWLIAAIEAGKVGLMLPAALLASLAEVSRSQVPRAIAWLVKFDYVRVHAMFEHHPEGFVTREWRRRKRGLPVAAGAREKTKHAQLANLLLPGPRLEAIIARRAAHQGSHGVRSDGTSLSNTLKEKLKDARARAKGMRPIRTILSEHRSQQRRDRALRRAEHKTKAKALVKQGSPFAAVEVEPAPVVLCSPVEAVEIRPTSPEPPPPSDAIQRAPARPKGCPPKCTCMDCWAKVEEKRRQLLASLGRDA